MTVVNTGTEDPNSGNILSFHLFYYLASMFYTKVKNDQLCCNDAVCKFYKLNIVIEKVATIWQCITVSLSTLTVGRVFETSEQD